MDLGSRKLGSRITHLPNEHLYLIFQKLDENLDRESFGLTCHLFFDIQNSSRKSLDLVYLPRKVGGGLTRFNYDSVMLDKLLNRFKQLESLSLTGCCGVFDSGLVLLQNYGSKLHSIQLDYCRGITDVGFSYIASGCPSLSYINLFDSSIEDSGLEILTKSCKSLKEVNLGWCESITDNGIRSLIQNCRQLRALRISLCLKVYGKGFEGCSPTLAYLEADRCGFITGFNEPFCGGGLEYLNIAFHSKNIRGYGLATIGSGVAANLKILNLWKCNFVTDEAIISISKGCPLLQEWNLSYCDKIRISGWEAIGLHCQSLEMIHVSLSLLCDGGLLAMGNGCKRLSVIYMKHCICVTPSGIKRLKMQRKDVKIKGAMKMKFAPSWAFTPFRSDI